MAEDEVTPTDAPPETAVEDIPDSIQKLKTGRIRFVLDGTTYTWRPARVGDYDALSTLWDEKILNPSEAEAKTPAEKRMLDWWEKAFTVLGDKRLPARKSLPPWFYTVALVPTLFAHWREVPLSPSEQ